jgi:ATP phosphoribosyltransferase
LILNTNRADVQLVIVRASDVPTYVEYGAADAGVAGKDVLLEYGGDLYEPVDLQIAVCRLMVAGPMDEPPIRGRLRIASKYANVTRRHYAQKGEQVEVIKLYGSMELAPLVGLADRIVDVVDTGGTLKANGLEPKELIAHISSRLIVNKASMKMKSIAVRQLIDGFEAAAARRQTHKADI